jgi:hypothetical protein
MTLDDLLRQLILSYLWGIAVLGDWPKHFFYAAISGASAFSLTWITSRLCYRGFSRELMATLRDSRLDLLIDLCFVVFSLFCALWSHIRLDGLW